MAACAKKVTVVDVHQLSTVVRNNIDTVLIIDSRSFLEFNTCHIIGAVNVYCSKIVKRRLQQDKVSVKELLTHTCQWEVDESYDVVVYDQGSLDVAAIPADSFVSVLLKKLLPVFRSVNLVKGGFLEFQAAYPHLCEDKTRKCAPLTSLSQPCLPITNQGPTRILPFLYLGSQHDALNQELLKSHSITYELNVSNTCPKPDFIQDAHFMRIPVNDNYNEKLLPHFPETFRFLDKVRQASGHVLVHCLAGISRSPTIAIAYVMRHLRMSSDDAYRYVKSKRPTISPNFNFLGQLLEYEKQLRREKVLEAKCEVSSAPPISGPQKRLCITDMRARRNLTLNISMPDSDSDTKIGSSNYLSKSTGDQSPTTALAKLSFTVDDHQEGETVGKCLKVAVPAALPAFGKHELSRSRSLNYADDWLQRSTEKGSVKEETVQAVRRIRENKLWQKAITGSLNPALYSAKGETSEDVSHSIRCKQFRMEQSSKGIMTSSASSNSVFHNVRASTEKVASKPAEGSLLTTSDWHVESLPISSIKELNFTPCQASSSNTLVETNRDGRMEKATWVAKLHKTSGTMQIASSRSLSTGCFEYSDTKNSPEQAKESSLENKSQSANEQSPFWFGSSPLISDSSIELIPSSRGMGITRSDSVCTSGLGSEASESSLGDCFSSMEGGFDNELDDAVFRKPLSSPMKTTWEAKKSPDSGHQSLNIRHPNLTVDKCLSEMLQSPVSPSERHFMEDFEDLEQVQENIPQDSSGFTLWKTTKSLGIMDSGILLSPAGPSEGTDTEVSIFADAEVAKGLKISPTEDMLNRKHSVLSEMPSQNVSKSLSENSEQATSDRLQGCADSKDITTCFNWSRRPSLGKPNMPDTETQPFGKSASALKSDGLYRAQSCPGILGWLRAATPSGGSTDKFRLPTATSQGGGDWETPRLRKRTTTQAERASKYRNRYSCGSLDHGHVPSEAFGYESCPDALHVGGCQSANSPSTPDSGSSLSPSHGVFRQSLSMIQVS